MVQQPKKSFKGNTRTSDRQISKYLSRPIAVVFEQRCRKNITVMAEKAGVAGCRFHPHFKTHQSTVIGNWFKDAGINSITVSSVEMAGYFADNGWNEITIAFPFFPGQMQSINQLGEKCRIRLFVTDPETVSLLNEQIRHPADILIEIDAGYGRSGVTAGNMTMIADIVNALEQSEMLSFAGFYIHDGATYQAGSFGKIKETAQRDFNAFKKLSQKYPGSVFCMGDTPSCSILKDFGPVTELSPGNFIFYDLMQVQIGSCSINDVALLVKAPVAQVKQQADQIIVHCGAAHLSKDFITENGRPVYGKPVYFDEEDNIQFIPGSVVTSLSQEHGTVSGAKNILPHINADGSIWICPVHSCLTANLFEVYHTADHKTISKKILS